MHDSSLTISSETDVKIFIEHNKSALDSTVNKIRTAADNSQVINAAALSLAKKEKHVPTPRSAHKRSNSHTAGMLLMPSKLQRQGTAAARIDALDEFEIIDDS